jgi:three-Cys-motif partner protein
VTRPKKPDEVPLFPNLEVPPRPPRRNRKALNLPAGLDLDKYERDEQDKLLREIVGSWVRKKHAVLQEYVGYTRSVRQKWCSSGPPGTNFPPAGATYIDLFSGPGRVRIENTKEVLPGSPLVAWESRGSGTFTALYVADACNDVAQDCRQRLAAAGAPAELFVGPADETVEQVLAKVNKHAYHFAFLDPFNLGNLSFEVIQKLSRRLKHVDILAHVSVLDLNRNLRRYIEEHGSSLDRFAPGWRKAVDISLPDDIVRESIMQHWRGLLKTIDMKVADALPLITGNGGQPLYWLAFASRHPLGHKFWSAMQPPPERRSEGLFG